MSHWLSILGFGAFRALPDCSVREDCSGKLTGDCEAAAG